MSSPHRNLAARRRDGGLTNRTQYSYRMTAWNDCNGNGSFDAGVDTVSATSNLASATAQ